MLFIALPLTAQPTKQQEKEAPAKKSRKAEIDYLEEARSLKTTDPNRAIRLLEEAIVTSKRKNNLSRQAEAFFLLGKIYEKIQQTDLALQRYQQVLEFISEKENRELFVDAWFQIGKLYTEKKEVPKAEEALMRAAKANNTPLKKRLIEEAFADLEATKNNYQQAIKQYDKLQQYYTKNNDSLAIARIEAKKSQAFLNTKDRGMAKQSYQRARSNYPKNKMDYQDYQVIEQTNQILLESAEDEAEKLEQGLENISYQKESAIPSEAAIEEQLQLADIYIERGEMDEAEKYVTASKNLVDDKVSPEKSAKVFKKSSELKLKKGAYEEALEDYQRYITENEKVLQQKQQELDQQVAILKNQKKIDLLVKDFAIEEKESQLLQSQIFSQKIIIAFLGILLIAALISFYFIWKNVNARRRANQLLYLKSLRTQMNPHFIFNALNSVNHYIHKNDERAANRFLSDFSKLMRMVLDYSQLDFITMEEERNLLKLYLKLEHIRFKDRFDYEINEPDNIDFSAIEIPPMLIQPFVENAVWHGLRYKKEKGFLSVTFTKENNVLQIDIKDNGIGREKSKALKTQNQQKYKSTGLRNVSKRIDLINKVYQKKYDLEINDLKPGQDDPGTFVRIKIPF